MFRNDDPPVDINELLEALLSSKTSESRLGAHNLRAETLACMQFLEAEDKQDFEEAIEEAARRRRVHEIGKECQGNDNLSSFNAVEQVTLAHLCISILIFRLLR